MSPKNAGAAKSTKVHVDHPDGPILISVGGADPVTFAVVGGSVDVPNEHLEAFLRSVAGSSTSPPAAPAAEEK